MSTNIKSNFAKSLQNWIIRNYGDEHGSKKKAAYFLGVSEGTLSNWIAMRRSPDENRKHIICEKIGISYNQAIGVAVKTESETGSIIDNLTNEHLKLVKYTIEILQSGTEFAKSLEANINSFHKAVNLELRENAMKAEVAHMKNRVIERRTNPDRRNRSEPVVFDRRNGNRRKSGI